MKELKLALKAISVTEMSNRLVVETTYRHVPRLLI